MGRAIQILQARLAGVSVTEVEARLPLTKLTLRLRDVSFDAIKEPAARERFFSMPATFVLASKDVGRLREIAGRLLRQSEDCQSLLRDVDGSLAKGGANATWLHTPSG